MATSLHDFTLVAPKTLLYTPPKHIPGQLIILCTWLGAARKHIQKYVALHQIIAPNAQILVLESDLGTITSNYVRYRRKLEPAVKVVLDVLEGHRLGVEVCKIVENGHRHELKEQQNDNLHQRRGLNGNLISNGNYITDANDAPPHHKIILHTFSNGGTNTAAQLLISLRSRSSHAPISATYSPSLILDSGPARGTYWEMYAAMVVSIPPGLMRIFASFIVHSILILLYTWIYVLGNEHAFALQRRILLEGNGNGHDSGGPPGRICYLYSKADLLCPWSDVSEHANDAREKGWDVTEIVFQESGHCAHLAKYPEEYTAAVEKMWSLA